MIRVAVYLMAVYAATLVYTGSWYVGSSTVVVVRRGVRQNIKKYHRNQGKTAI